ncbi:MAG: CPBP family intramembrane metalloprotease [Leptolyngbya sp. SIO1D8]|nr:CPBP family intramembrane metalloprotease [Leptolyngbya sp. SIO1D8]
MKAFWRFWGRCPALIRILGYFVGVLLLAAPLAIPIYQFEYAATQGKSVIWAPICLLGVFVLCLPLWARGIHRLSSPWRVLGFVGGWKWWQQWLWAFVVGAVGVAILYLLQLVLGWGTWVSPTDNRFIRHLLEGFLVGLGVGMAEELVFRGWLLFELEQDYSLQVALWVNASLFAIAHYIRPLSVILETWPQFFGLLLLGLTLVWARRIPVGVKRSGASQTSLSWAAGLHGGLVWANYQVDVNDLVLATGKVPDSITGIGGNPLAGVLGLLLLGTIAIATYIASHRTQLD